jgi:hypothetical protein
MNINHKDTGHLSTLSRHIKPGHLRATRMLGYGLTLADYAGWAATSAVWCVHLRPSEIAAIAIASMGALDDDVFQVVMDYLETGK